MNDIHTGEFHCPICREIFILTRDTVDTDGIWTFGIIHDHSSGSPVWRGTVYGVREGRRLPPEEKDRRSELHRQKQSLREQAAAIKRGDTEESQARTREYQDFLRKLKEGGREFILEYQRGTRDREGRRDVSGSGGDEAPKSISES